MSAIHLFQCYFFGLLVLAGIVFCAKQDIYVVTKISDGDTIRVKNENGEKKIRMICIDAPEMAQIPHGQFSTNALE
jgi:endonuclease YncB( thermonuclease family)